jgi:basic membrane lipoprotein Med (substrate-binding protein (PBP1-ABC) superfamily)
MVVAAGAVALGVWALGRGPAVPASAAVRTRVYESFQACLLTGPRGIVGAPAGQAWAGMEDASLKTRAKVSYLAVSGPATEANAVSFLGSLLVRNCDVIVAAGAPEQAAVLADAARFPRVRFIVAGRVAPEIVGESNVASASRTGLRSAVGAMVAADVSAN